MHMPLKSILFCPITSMDIDVFFYDKLQDWLFCLPCVWGCGCACACVLEFYLAISHKVLLYVLQTW